MGLRGIITLLIGGIRMFVPALLSFDGNANYISLFPLLVYTEFVHYVYDGGTWNRSDCLLMSCRFVMKICAC